MDRATEYQLQAILDANNTFNKVIDAIKTKIKRLFK